MATVLARSNVVKVLARILRVLHAGRCSLWHYIHYIFVPVEEERLDPEHDIQSCRPERCVLAGFTHRRSLLITVSL